MSPQKPSISVFFPCYNDAESIGELIENAFSVLQKLTSDYEVIVIDDVSTDKSREVLKDLSKRYDILPAKGGVSPLKENVVSASIHPRHKWRGIFEAPNKNLKLVFHEKNEGYGGTLRSGFKAASKDLIFYTDGDGQYDVRELPILFHLMTHDTNFVNGIKMTRRDPTYRILAGNLYSFFARWLFWLPVYDVDCDFRLIKKDLLKKLHLTGGSGSICVELVKKAQRAGGRFRQVSVHHYERRFGQSQFFRPERLFATLAELAKLWFGLMVVDILLRRK